MKMILTSLLVSMALSSPVMAVGLSVDPVGPAVVVNAAGYSCSARLDGATTPDQGPFRLEVPSLKLHWHGDGDLQLIFMRVDLTSAGFSSNVRSTFADSELNAVWTGTTGGISQIASGETLSSQCALSMGDIPVASDQISFFGQGTLTIYGLVTNVNGDQSAVNVQTPFSFEYVGVPAN